MKITCPTSVVLSRTALAAAISLVLASPVYAADQKSATNQYDSAVAYSDQHDSYKLRASELIGRDIHNADDDEIGEIDDLIVSRDGDKIMAIVSLGGFFDLGSKLVAIPYQDLRVAQDGEHVYYNATKDELRGRSEFTYADKTNRNNAVRKDDKVSTADGRQSSVAAKADANDRKDDASRNKQSAADDRQQRVAAKGDPDHPKGKARHATDNRATVAKTKSAGNSAHEMRESSGKALTPFDQSHAEADVDITRAIREILVDDDTLGTRAQNVKVITIDGMVTLRGPVESSAEHARIVAVAKQAAGVDRVQDELQVMKR